jgi:hypothetical protein
VGEEVLLARGRVTNCVVGRIATPLLVLLGACGSEHAARQTRDSTRVEAAIESSLQQRIGVALRVRCVWIVPSCRAHLPDGSTMDVLVGWKRGELEWKLDGMLALADDVEAYLRDVLAELGAPQVARCGARIRALHVDDRIECALQNGGRAFAVATAEGKLAFEIVLDPASGAARSEVVTIERSIELEKMSKKLDGDADGEDEDE